jgi:hypothetical protein
MHLDAHTLGDYLDRFLRELPAQGKGELAELARACGGDAPAASPDERADAEDEPPARPGPAGGAPS